MSWRALCLASAVEEGGTWSAPVSTATTAPETGISSSFKRFFGFGLLLSLTPCVWPKFPILSGIIAGQGTSIGKGFGVIGLLVGAIYLIGAFSGGHDFLQPLQGVMGSSGRGTENPLPLIKRRRVIGFMDAKSFVRVLDEAFPQNTAGKPGLPSLRFDSFAGNLKR